ncbi:D-alanyl-D-alanine carboxypeptidase family protein [Pararhodospirillum oryzae]|uniref:Peptidase S11 D-alanyl-D-alanine carboxypeptidase A N-terminal domain-containing protein n=1 Tax=Pararhodospirillum oryzae TaxID=478448 RepID=A0A512H8W7_9PROT|nr:D-alanyl-D-alanine carboxypeptidase family protein [Pararhodospirillum oryzae]GEO81893.1 hypothetical protein ROR02_20240 [Pararhodospirillum oryzae]
MIPRPVPSWIAAVLAFWLGLAAVLARPAGAEETYLVVDAQNGAVLLADAPDRRVPPASLAKMMTAYLAFEDLRDGRLAPDAVLSASARAAAADPVGVGLAPGEKVPLPDALRALLGLSANDVAVMIAETLAGSEEAFATRMTDTARRLGLRHTRFASASGLPAPLDDQYTTARDMAVLALALERDFPQHRGLFALQGFLYKGRGLHGHNALLGRLRGADGLKTGFTCASGYNIAASVRRDGRHLIGILLGSTTGAERTDRIEGLLLRALATPLDEKTPFIDDPDPRAGEEPLPVVDNRQRTPVCVGTVAGELLAGGHALDLGLARSRSQAMARAAAVAHQTGGQPYSLPRPGTGLMRWNAYVGGFAEATARQICRRRQAAGAWCLVRTPQMVRGDFAAAARLARAR